MKEQSTKKKPKQRTKSKVRTPPEASNQLIDYSGDSIKSEEAKNFAN